MRTFFSIFVIVVLIAGCRKYPEDKSWPHLRSPEKRLSRVPWRQVEIFNYLTNTNFATASFDYIEFTDDGKFSGDGYPYLKFHGTWSLTNHKKNLLITDDKGNSIEYVIRRLDANVVIFRSDSMEYSLVPTERQ